MEIPHISIEYREDHTFTIGKISPWLIFGFSLCFAWIFLLLFENETLLFYADTSVQTLLFVSFFISLTTVLLIYGLFLKSMRRLFKDASARTRNRLIATILLTLASIVICFGYLVPTAFFDIMAIGSGVMAGIGIAVLLMNFAVSFSVTDITETAVCVAASLVLIAIFYVLLSLSFYSAFPVSVTIYIILPAAQFLCLQKSSPNIVDNLNFLKLTLPIRGLPFFMHMLLPDLTFGMIAGLLQLGISTSFDQYEDAALAFLAGGIFASLLLFLVTVTQRQTTNFVFRTQLPIVGVLLACLFISTTSSAPYTLFILSACLFILTGCLWIMFADLSQTFRISVFTTFGYGWSIFTLSSFLSYILVRTFFYDQISLNNPSFYVVLVLMLCLFGFSLLPTTTEIRQSFKQDRGCLALVDPDDFVRNVFYDTKNPTSTESLPGNRNLPPQQKDEATLQAQTNVAGTDIKETEPSHTHFYKLKIAKLADQYSLSRRETEVLYLLGKGKNSSSIRGELYISAGTANTHMRHIYRKLNVHSQQELMRLVESVWINKGTGKSVNARTPDM